MFCLFQCSELGPGLNVPRSENWVKDLTYPELHGVRPVLLILVLRIGSSPTPGLKVRAPRSSVFLSDSDTSDMIFSHCFAIDMSLQITPKSLPRVLGSVYTWFTHIIDPFRPYRVTLHTLALSKLPDLVKGCPIFWTNKKIGNLRPGSWDFKEGSFRSSE